ncbi:MAG: iron-containing alcohol dehydrogenase [Defluviitaleaceae bacterium]|nr:iron-containing alcohol dehydrogenase [Defluviitaleaceae bacterium]
MYKTYCRIYQKAFKAGAVFLPWRRPKRLGGYSALANLLSDKNCDSVLVVTDKGLTSRDLHEGVIGAIRQAGACSVIYDNTAQNPTIDNVDEALALYRAKGCKAIVALGGGSAIDCGKGVGARLARKNKTLHQLRGPLKVWLKMPLFIAIPTTAGSGSEVSVAALVTDSRTNDKFAINDPALIPHYVLHDPHLTVGLPAELTATTGMDALCHAVEAYIGNSNTCRTQMDAIKAVRIIFGNLYDAYLDGHNIKARANMQKAAYLAGAAFTRAYVGNIHAMSHAISGLYGTPHGLVNAVIMPYILDAYGSAIHKPLKDLAIAASLADSSTPKVVATRRFIDAIRDMNSKMGIQEKLSGINTEDIPKLAKHALREANPLYPVPVIFDYDDMVKMFHQIRS